MTDAESLYHERILRLDAEPDNEGRLEAPSHRARCSNPLCGDRIELELRVEDGVVLEASFVGRGCALSRASASMLTVDVIGSTVEDALQRRVAIEAWLKQDGEMPPSRSGLEAMVGVRAFRGRLGCVTLPWLALERALA